MDLDDAASEAELDQKIAVAVDKYAGIDVLVNDAGFDIHIVSFSEKSFPRM